MPDVVYVKVSTTKRFVNVILEGKAPTHPSSKILAELTGDTVALAMVR